MLLGAGSSKLFLLAAPCVLVLKNRHKGTPAYRRPQCSKRQCCATQTCVGVG